jgi:hypothetical protein
MNSYGGLFSARSPTGIRLPRRYRTTSFAELLQVLPINFVLRSDRILRFRQPVVAYARKSTKADKFLTLRKWNFCLQCRFTYRRDEIARYSTRDHLRLDPALGQHSGYCAFARRMHLCRRHPLSSAHPLQGAPFKIVWNVPRSGRHYFPSLREPSARLSTAPDCH